MKSKIELLGKQEAERIKKFKSRVELMNDVLNKKYSNGLDFDKCPYVETLVKYSDVKLSYYSDLEKELAKVIERTTTFRKIADELIDNGFDYEIKTNNNYSGSTAEWSINLYIK